MQNTTSAALLQFLIFIPKQDKLLNTVVEHLLFNTFNTQTTLDLIYSIENISECSLWKNYSISLSSCTNTIDYVSFLSHPFLEFFISYSSNICLPLIHHPPLLFMLLQYSHLTPRLAIRFFSALNEEKIILSYRQHIDLSNFKFL